MQIICPECGARTTQGDPECDACGCFLSRRGRTGRSSRNVRRGDDRDDPRDEVDDDRPRDGREYDDEFDEDWQRGQSHRASLVMTMGTLSIFCCPLVVFGPLAWIMGASDLRQMREGRMNQSGQDETRTGMVLGIIGTVVSGCGFGSLFLFALRG